MATRVFYAEYRTGVTANIQTTIMDFILYIIEFNVACNSVYESDLLLLTSKDAEVTLKLGSTEDKREQYRLMRDAMEKRFIRVTRGSIVGGVRLGMFTAAFYSLQNLLVEQRGVHDVFNVVGASSATALAFGLILPGSLRWRARNMMLGSVLGAAFCFPLGWLHLKLIEKANEGNQAANENLDKRDIKSGVSAAIKRLESNLQK
ncbi:uncharacterized protein DS421_16g555110 [Arachis hypogaea]|nr:uncharacterized protein DS421_16g555110 [Arachis hypogaea]